MGIFVRQEVPVAELLLPFGEIAALDPVFRAAVMFQPFPAKIIGDRQQEVVMIIMLSTEELHRLVDQPLVRLDLLGLGG